MFISSADAFRTIFKSNDLPVRGHNQWKKLAKRMRENGFRAVVTEIDGKTTRGWVNQYMDDQGMHMVPQIDQDLHQILQLRSDEQERVEKEQIAKRAFADDATWQGLVQRNINKS